MHIFIDETGIFANPNKKDESVSAVGALCIPSRRLDSLCEKFARLKAKWGVMNGEVKGSKLNESQVRDTLHLLSKHKARAKLVLIDLGLHNDADLDAHRKRQAEGLTAELTQGHAASLRAELEEAQVRLAKLSLPLYVQLILITELVAEALQNFTLWHAARDGRELDAFHWIVDPKGRERVEYEKLWRLLVLGMIQSRSLAKPLFTMDGGDYRYFQRYVMELPERPHWLPGLPSDTSGPLRYPDPRLLLEDLTYPKSEESLGLQLVDIVVTTFRRALVGTLQAAGWKALSKLLIAETAGTIKLLGLFADGKEHRAKRSYQDVLLWLHNNASSMLPRRLYSR